MSCTFNGIIEINYLFQNIQIHSDAPVTLIIFHQAEDLMEMTVRMLIDDYMY